jgi:predicted RNase H-like HicB family nuclease
MEDDGRWIAEVVDMSGVMAYGATEKQAIDAVCVLALKCIAEKNQRPGELA